MISLALALAVLSAAPSQAVNPKEADALFKQARALLKEGKPAEACPLLEKSHLLDPALGTLLNLADCYQTTGRLVQAFLSFNEAAAWATRNHEANRAEIARNRAGALKGRLAWLALSTQSPTVGLTVSVNDFVVELGTAAQSVPVDAGPLRIVASAPDRLPWSTTVSVAPRQTVAVAVPALGAQLELKKPGDLVAFEATLSRVPMVQSRPPPPPPSRAPAVGLMAAGAALAATGVAGLAWSFNTHERLQRQQPGQPSFGTPTVTRGDLDTLRWVYPASWATAAVGVAALAGGSVWYLKGGRTTLAVVPSASGVGLAASGTF